MAKIWRNQSVYTSLPLLFLAALMTNRVRVDMNFLPIQTKATHPPFPSLHIICKYLGRTRKGNNQRNRTQPLPHRVSKHFRIEKDLLLASLAHLLLPRSDRPKIKTTCDMEKLETWKLGNLLLTDLS